MSAPLHLALIPTPTKILAVNPSLPVSIRGVSKRYGSTSAVNDISLDIAAGEFVTLLGPSGSGKTTLLNILAGFIRLDRGQVFFGDEDVTLTAPHKRNVGLVFQNYALFPHMSVAENVAFPLRARNVAKATIDAKVRWALELVKLEGFGQRGAAELSGGQRQRVALARAVVFQPNIILMDEPLSALDKKLREHMQIEIRQLHETLGATTVYVTHDQREALTMSDRVAVLNAGSVIQFDRPRQLYDHPANPFIADFVGESTLLPVRRAGTHAVLLGEILLETMEPLPADDGLLLVVRSEKLVPARPGIDHGNLIRARVLDIVFQGESVAVYIELDGGGRVVMRQPSHQGSVDGLPARGAEITLTLSPENAVVVAEERG